MGADGGADAAVIDMAGLSGGAMGVEELTVLEGLTTLPAPLAITLVSGDGGDSCTTDRA